MRGPALAFVVFAALVAASAAVDPANIRMWTAAKPCPQTQQYFGSFIKGNTNRVLNVLHGYPSISAWTRGLIGFANGLRAQAGGTQDITTISDANTEIKAFADKNKKTVKELVQSCTALLAKGKEKTGQNLNYALPKPATKDEGKFKKGGVIPGAIDSGACPELCALVVSSCPESVGTQSRSCSVALGRGAGKSNAAVRIAVSGGTACSAPSYLDTSDVNVFITRQATSPITAKVSWVSTRVTVDSSKYDTCEYDGTTKKCKVSQSVKLDDKIGFSPALEAVWQGKISSGKFLNPDEATDNFKNPRAASKKNQGICSEDKLINDFIAVNSVE